MARPLRLKRQEAQDLRREVFERAHWTCEARHALGTVCSRREVWAGRGHLEAHHRLMRSQGGPDTLENLVAVCRTHHAEIHAHPARSYELGLLIPSWAGPPEKCWEPPSIP